MARFGSKVALASLLAAASVVPATAQANNPEQTRGENGPESAPPLKLTFNYASDFNDDVAGGQSRGLAYLGRASLLLDADLGRLAGLRGVTAHASVVNIHGVGLSNRHVGNLLLVSGLEAAPALRLNQLWLQLTPAADVSLRVGKFTAAQDFALSNTANLFVNSTFGWQGSFATDLPSGGPAYPIAGPGARLAYMRAGTVLKGAVFAGDPAGQGGGDPQHRDSDGLNSFRLAGKPFIIAEIDRQVGADNSGWTWKLGGWVHFNRFDNIRSQASPAGAPVPPFARDFSVYGVVDGLLWTSSSNSKRQLRAFARATYSPPDRNAIDLYLDTGLTIGSPFAGRDNDTVGIAAAVARVSTDLRAAARQRLRAGAPGTVPPDAEAVLELSYSAEVVGPLKLQPNVQYVVSPAISAIAIATPRGRVADAIVLGLRTSIFF